MIIQPGNQLYTISTFAGKVVTKKTKDLNDLTSALNIQVDNPVCILSQDTARNFLNATDNKKRFDLFYRATRLDHLNQMLVEAIKNKNMAIKEFTIKKDQESALIKKTVKLKRKIEDAREAEELKHKLEELNNEKAWATTITNETKYKKQKKVVDNMMTDLKNIEDTYEKQQQSVQAVEQEKR